MRQSKIEVGRSYYARRGKAIRRVIQIDGEDVYYEQPLGKRIGKGMCSLHNFADWASCEVPEKEIPDGLSSPVQQPQSSAANVELSKNEQQALIDDLTPDAIEMLFDLCDEGHFGSVLVETYWKIAARIHNIRPMDVEVLRKASFQTLRELEREGYVQSATVRFGDDPTDLPDVIYRVTEKGLERNAKEQVLRDQINRRVLRDDLGIEGF